ncbi:MAG TPA: RtcB family protein [Longimicrobiales bacterium]|nr:RtcB family protein [Longimicrobiales bacterium]
MGRKKNRKARRSTLTETAATSAVPVLDVPKPAPVWGRDLIDPAAITQMENAMRLPVTIAGALMPDAHVGYGIPIGGVVALENAVAPYMVGVDIACRMHMSIFANEHLDLIENASRREQLKRAMREETRFGIGASFEGRDRREHAVMEDEDWSLTKAIAHLKDKAWTQLGTSGSGNHFLDAGVLIPASDDAARILGIEPGREHFAFMSHSGSRGTGAQIADHYSRLAQQITPLPPALRHLAWLPLDSDPGQEYWRAMNLMGRYAQANHESLHRHLQKHLKLKAITELDNHHNFAWKETLADGTVAYVHRKGATPAGAGVLGIIPGSQGHDSFIVRGKGSALSLNSASHGAGRMMSRGHAKRSIPKADRDRWLESRGVELMDAGMDEAPQAYKDIRQVLAEQSDLVEVLATFRPRVVLMARAGERAED